MANLGNTPRPGYVYDTETDTWVPIGVGAHTHAYIPNTLVDAKGDIVVASASDTPAILSKGEDGTVLVADSTTSTGLAWQPYAAQIVAGKNFIINGNFDFWQRGTSFAATGAATTSTYTADRWNSGANSNVTISRVSASTEGSIYAVRIQKNSGTSTGGDALLCHTIESSNTIMLAGKTVTLSFNVRSGANFSGSAVYCVPRFGTALDESSSLGYGGGWAGHNQILLSVTPTTTMTRYTKTFTVPSGTKSMMLLMGVQSFGSSSAGANDWIEFEKIQLEVGPIATPFSRAAGTLQSELAACQRYYQKYSADVLFGDLGFNGKATTTTNIAASRTPYVQFRVTPTLVDFSNVTWIVGWGGATTAVSTIALSSYATKDMPLLNFTTTGVTAGTNYIILGSNNTAGYIGISAEL